MYKYSISVLMIAAVFMVPLIGHTQDSEQDSEDDIASLKAALVEQIEELRERVSELQEQIAAMRAGQQELREENAKLRRELRQGMRGEDVEALQEVLSTDPSIYPEGLVTGYYGPLTEAAVKRFRQKHGLGEEDGEVRGKSLEVLNRLLTEGAGNSGKVPPGLLTAPGLAKARCAAGIGSQDRCETKQDDDDEEDDTDDNEDVDTEIEIEYDDGVYEVEGVVAVSTPCHELDINIDVDEGDPDEVEIDISSFNDVDEVCAQVITEREFERTFEAGADAEITVIVDGEEVEFDFEGEDDEDDD